MSAHIQFTHENGVARLVIDRVEKKNALDWAMYEALIAGLRQADQEAAVVVLSGAQGVFTAGNDLRDFMTHGLEAATDNPALTLLRVMTEIDVSVIAAVDGPAIGIGTTLLMHCDAVYAGPSAKFSTPFVDLGLCPEGGSSRLFPARLGRAATFRLLMAGEALQADEALAAGLVDQVVDDPLSAALAAAAALAEKPRGALRATKRLLREAEVEATQAAIAREGRVFAARLAEPETQAAFARFFTRK